MKSKKEKISSFNLSALLLIIIMLFPSAFQFAHAFEDHEQNECYEITTHLHEQEVECSICDFHIPSFTYSFFNELEHTLIQNQTIYADFYKSKKHNSIKQSFSLRGPPQFL